MRADRVIYSDMCHSSTEGSIMAVASTRTNWQPSKHAERECFVMHPEELLGHEEHLRDRLAPLSADKTA